MAQTRKKRRTKHRGNAVGMVEARGRTGRKPTDGEKKKPAGRQDARARREERMNRPPTWRAAFNRAAISAVIFVVLLILLFKQEIPAALGLGAFVLLFYIPLGYVTDSFMYKRRQRRPG